MAVVAVVSKVAGLVVNSDSFELRKYFTEDEMTILSIKDIKEVAQQYGIRGTSRKALIRKVLDAQSKHSKKNQ